MKLQKGNTVAGSGMRSQDSQMNRSLKSGHKSLRGPSLVTEEQNSYVKITLVRGYGSQHDNEGEYSSSDGGSGNHMQLKIFKELEKVNRRLDKFEGQVADLKKHAGD